MKMSVDGKIEGPAGDDDWVESWSDDYDLIDQVDACLLGATMYPGCEGYWTAVQREPYEPLPMTGGVPTPNEVADARFATVTPHHVVSSTITSARWPNTRFVRGVDEIVALNQQSGRDIYLIGGARTTGLSDAGLVDELRITVHPLVAGEGKELIATTERRRALELRTLEQLQDGRVGLIYEMG
jgi:dihydrofolate reductase